MSNEFDGLCKRVAEIIVLSPIEEDQIHSEEVCKNVLKLYPNAQESLKIAALCHDIERGVKPRVNQLDGESYREYKQKHAERSAMITAKLMKEFGYSENAIMKVVKLIKLHEIGGNKTANILRDADSISYFNSDIDFYFKRSGPIKTKDKIRFMYNRASERAKKIIKSIRYTSDVQKLIDVTIND